jgi:hypothetical protein
MDAGVCQVVDLLGGNGRGAGWHVDACLPSSNVWSDSSVASRVVHLHKVRKAFRNIKPKSRGLQYELMLS